MAVSGTCAALTPVIFGASPIVVVPVFLVWGFAVVADSAQYSTMATETADDALRGTALQGGSTLGY